MLDDIIQGDTILVIDDLERKSPSLEMVDLLGFIEMYREKCSVIVIGNTAGIEGEDKAVFDRYSERLFDQQYILTDISAEVLELVMNKNVGTGVSAEARKLIIASFRRSRDSNMRTLLKIGIVVTEAFHQLAEHDAVDLLESKFFIPTIVALMIEKHSKGKDISSLPLDRSWIVPDDATSAFLKEYSLSTRIGFSLAPFVELIEHKRLMLSQLNESLGVKTLDELEIAFHKVIYYWCHSMDLVKSAWKKVSQAMEGTSISRFTLREIVDFAYASTSIRALILDLFDDREFESWIIDRLSAATKDVNHETLESQFENVSLGYEALREKPLIDKMAAIIKKEALVRRSSTLKAQFDREYTEGQFYRAFSLIEDRDFPTTEISEILARSGDASIPDDYFFALRTLIKDLKVPESRRIVIERLSRILHDSNDPLVQARIQGLLDIEKEDKT